MTIALALLRQFWPYIVMALLAAAVYHYKHDAKDARNELALFKADIATKAAQAERDAAKKEKADEQKINAAVAGRDAALASLRAAQAQRNSGRGSVPYTALASPAGSQKCIDPAAATAAVERYRRAVAEGRRRVEEIVGIGDEAQIDAKSLLSAWPQPK